MPFPTAILYTHSVVFVGDEWYAHVLMYPLAAHTREQNVLTILHVKHGWPVHHIYVAGATQQPLCLGDLQREHIAPKGKKHYLLLSLSHRTCA